MENSPNRKDVIAKELADLSLRFGKPVEEWVTILKPESSTGPAGFPLSSRRTAEVVLIVPRTNGRILFHTKGFYPSGIWRLPTGGLHRRESIEAALRRETFEEVGQDLSPTRFLFHIHFRWDNSDKDFQSYGFLMSEAHGPIQSRDRREQISAFRDLDRPAVQTIAKRLESLHGTWTAWGKFRAIPHRALLRLWSDDGFAAPGNTSL